MSTRVEKGGPKFKPVLKSKSRPPPPSTSATPSDFCWLRPSVGPAQSDISQVTSTQGASTETAQPREVSPSPRSIANNVSRQPATPILISNPRTRSSATHVTPTPSSRNQITPTTISGSPSSPHTVTGTSEPAATPQPSNDKQQESDKRSTVSQKRPKQAFLDREEQAKKKRRSKRAAIEETQNDGTDTALAKTGELVEESQVSQNSSLKRKRTESARREGSTRLDDEGQSSSETAVKRRRRRKITVEVPEGPIDPIDPTQITMRAICDDPGSGRKSSRWETSQALHAEARKIAKEERARLIIEAEQRERDSGRSSSKRAPFQPTLPSTGASSERGEERADEFSYDESLKASHYAPQVRIGANGEIVLDVDSLQVDRSADPDIVEEYNHIEENDHSRFTNSNSWSKRRLVRWGKEDTALFYAALRQFGQNFDLIARVLPGKTYRMCKNKFKAEDKKNPALIDEALRNVVAVDLNVLSQMTGKDFTGPTPTITAKPTLSLADADDSTTAQQQDNNAVESENLEGSDKNEQQHEQEPREVIEASIAPETLPPESTFTTARQSESPPPADTLLERSPSISTKEAGSDTSGKPTHQPILVGAPKRAIPILPNHLYVTLLTVQLPSTSLDVSCGFLTSLPDSIEMDALRVSDEQIVDLSYRVGHIMGSPQAVIRPLVVNKRRSLDAIERRQECSNNETRPGTERFRSRRFSLPIEVIPELNEPQDSKSSSSVSDHDEISRESILLYSGLEQHKDYLLHKAKELERGAYRALFEAEYLRWQAENNCHAFPMDPSIPAALSLKAEELGLRPRNLSLDSISTTSLPTQSHSRSTTNLVEKKIPSVSKRAQRTESLNMKFLGTSLPSPSSALSLSPLSSHCPASPFVSSSHHELEYEDSELRPILRTGKRTLKKPRFRTMGHRHLNEPRSFFADDTHLPKKKWFRFKCPFLFLVCCFRHKKYRPCRQSMGPF